MKQKVSLAISYLRTNWILIDDYDYKGIKISAKDCQRRLGIHFLWPFAVSLLVARYTSGYVLPGAWAVIWGALVARKEWKESAWQTPLKTRSDVLSKLLGLIGLLLP